MLVSWEIQNGSHDFFHTLSMALCHKWDVKNDFAYVLQFFSLISDGLGSVFRLGYSLVQCIWLIFFQKICD